MSRHIAGGINSRITLNDGISMPMFGLGMFRSQGGEGGEAEQAVIYALSRGYRLIDTAEYHGTESDVGRGIKLSGISREQVFVVSKIWENGYDRCLQVVKDSLQKMDLQYFDLYCIHTPANGKNVETYRALMELQKQGLIKSVGVSNFGAHHLEGLKAEGLPTPTVNQLELHPWQRKPDIVQYCRNHGIGLMAYSPIVKGNMLEDETLLKLAEKYNKTPAQILIRWSIQQGFIPIPKSSNPERISSNTGVFDWSINDDDIALLETFSGLPLQLEPND